MLMAIKNAAEGKYFKGDTTVQLAEFSREMQIHTDFMPGQPGYSASEEISSRRFCITGIVDVDGQHTTWTLQVSIVMSLLTVNLARNL